MLIEIAANASFKILFYLIVCHIKIGLETIMFSHTQKLATKGHGMVILLECKDLNKDFS